MKSKFLFLAFLISCSSSQKKNLNKSKYDVGQINDTSFEEELKNSSSKIQVNENLENNTSEDSYGPIIVNNQSANNVVIPTSKEFHILYFHPEDFRSFSYVGVLKKISKNKSINPVMIGGSCFSAVISSLYSKYKDYNSFEWNVYKLHNKLKGVEFNSDEYYEQVLAFVADEFKTDEIEKLKLSGFILTTNNKKTSILEIGKLNTLLSKHIKDCQKKAKVVKKEQAQISLLKILEKRNLNKLYYIDVSQSDTTSIKNLKTSIITIPLKKSSKLQKFDYYLKSGLDNLNI